MINVRYPDPWAEGLRIKLAQYSGVAKKNIMIGNSFNELSQLILLAFAAEGQMLLTPPNFVMDKIEPETKVIFICSPKNSTGKLVSVTVVEKLLQQTKALVVLYGACYEFAGKTAVKLLEKYPNLIILRTFAEAFGTESLKIGYLLTNRGVLKELVKVKEPCNLNVFSQRIAEIVLGNLLVKQEENKVSLAKLKGIVG